MSNTAGIGEHILDSEKSYCPDCRQTSGPFRQVGCHLDCSQLMSNGLVAAFWAAKVGSRLVIPYMHPCIAAYIMMREEVQVLAYRAPIGMPHTPADRDQPLPCTSSSPLLPSGAICSSDNATWQSPAKSAKRKRAEEVLEQRYAQQKEGSLHKVSRVDSSDEVTVSACTKEAKCSRHVAFVALFDDCTS